MSQSPQQPQAVNNSPSQDGGQEQSTGTPLPPVERGQLALEYGFILTKQEEIVELEATAREYKHIKTGATVFFINNDDTNCYASLTFRTASEHGKGIAHINEHMVFRGSEKFPGSDPVNSYLQESLYSASEAATVDDYTLYYCASPNRTDFNYQLEQLLDAVFAPKMRESAFHQEAWRVERDEKGKLSLNGIVLNEMRGYADDPLEVHNRAVVAALFPETHYTHNFAGDPRLIPDLTLQELREFARRHNHPSNSLTVLYGDLDRGKYLQLLSERFDSFEQMNTQPLKAQQARFEAPIRSTAYYPGAETEDAGRDSIVSLSWRLGRPTEIPSNVTLALLHELILGEHPDTISSSLLEQELGEDISRDGLDDSLAESFFSIVVTGTSASKSQEIEEAIIQLLNKTSQAGFPAEMVKDAINKIEIDLYESSESADCGEHVVWNLAASWSRGDDPLSSLRWKRELEELKANLARDPQYLEKLIISLFIENSHRLTMVVKPDRGLPQEWADRDTQKAESLGQTPTLPEPSEETTAVSRKLRIVDLPDKGTSIEREFEDGCWIYPIPKRELCTAAVAINFNHIPSELLPYLQLYTATLGSFGGRSSAGLGTRPGILDPSYFISQSPTGTQVGRILLSGTCLVSDSKEMLRSIAEQFDVNPLDDRRRLIRFMVQQRARFEEEIQQDSAPFCQLRSEAKLRNTSVVSDMMYGISALDNLRLMLVEARQRWGQFSDKLMMVREILLKNADPLWYLATSGRAIRSLLPITRDLTNRFGAIPGPDANWALSGHSVHEGFTVPSQVASTAVSFDLKAAGYSHHGSILVLKKIIEHRMLWSKVRQENGAYAPRISYDPHTSILTVGSGFDKLPTKTIAIAESVSGWLREIAPGIRQLRRGKIGAIGELDQPRSKAERAWEDFNERLCASPLNSMEIDRDQIFEAQQQHCLELAEVLGRALLHPYGITVMGSKDELHRINDARRDAPLTLRALEPRLSSLAAIDESGLEPKRGDKNQLDP